MAKGRTLSDEQQQAANRYNEVVANLDLTREFIQAFEKIGIETNKEEKKRKKQEQDEKKQQEFYKLKELFWIQVCLIFKKCVFTLYLLCLVVNCRKFLTACSHLKLVKSFSMVIVALLRLLKMN